MQTGMMEDIKSLNAALMNVRCAGRNRLSMTDGVRMARKALQGSVK